MILTKAPLRIPIAGGGTDLPSYYKKKGSFFISATINKYVYVIVSRPFTKGFHISYKKKEIKKNLSNINHPIIREALRMHYKSKYPQIEINSISDIPAGTGLGSSASFTNALILGLLKFQNKTPSKIELAKLSTELEMVKLKRSIGLQDQYASSIGGINSFKISKNGLIKANPIKFSKKKLDILEGRLSLFFTGFSRQSEKLLKYQKIQTNKNNSIILKNLDRIKYLAFQTFLAFRNNDFDSFGEIMNEHWIEKKKRDPNISNSQINDVYNYAILNGAKGGKLLGAGGGGFLLFYCKDKQELIKKMKKKKISNLEFKFEFDGCR